MKFKKPLVLAAALLFGALAFAGCKPKGRQIVDLGDDYDVQTGLPYDYEATLEIGLPPLPGAAALIQGPIDAFNERYPYIKFKVVTVQGGSDFNSSFVNYHNAGNAPDIIQTGGIGFFNLLDKKLLLNLKPYIEAEKEQNPGYEEQFIESMWKQGQKDYDGDQYVIPRSSDRVVTHYNKKIFADAGVDMTLVKNGWTWDDFLKVCATLRDYYDRSGKSDPPVWVNFDWEATVFPIFESCGGKVFGEGKVVSIDSPGTRDALNVMKNLVDLNYAASPNALQPNFEGGIAAMRFSSESVSEFAALGGNHDLVTFPLIGGDGKIGAGISGFSVYQGSPNRDAAWQFLSFLLGKNGQNALAGAGLTMPPIRKDMQDSSTNAWGSGFTDKNMAAYTWAPERNFITTFFVNSPYSNQLPLVETITSMVFDYLRKPGGKDIDTVLSECVSELDRLK
jgi:ABC-type glycerol-3-phosphate transport system substrate-binding protein